VDPQKIRPTLDYVLVKRMEAEEYSPGGIIIPEQAKERPQVGVVIAAGPGRYSDDGILVATQVSVGDKVLFAKYGGADIRPIGDDYVIMHEGEILAVLDD
jgi:chaperonin GroES